MKTIDKNDPAFSLHPEVNPYGVSSGLTKREYFAAMAMQGLSSNIQVWEQFTPAQKGSCAVELADALIEALNKEEK